MTWLLAAIALQLQLMPAVCLVGREIALRCIVPRAPDHRLVVLGVENWTSSARTVDGDRAPVIYELHLAHVPCEAGAAFCAVVDVNGHVTRLERPLYVGGCE